MSKSFKKVVACLLAVLMVMFSVPMTALAAVDTTEYTPDIQLQFNAFLNAADDAGSWVSNYADGKQYKKASGAAYDLSLSGLSSVQLKETATKDKTNAKYTVTDLKIEANDTATLAGQYDDWAEWGADVLSEDYSLKAGDAFTVTVRMDNLEKVYVATAEISYSGNITPIYVSSGGSGRNAWYQIGTAAQGCDGDCVQAASDPQALYTGINADEIGSELRTDTNGENFMYAECVAPSGAQWEVVNNSEAPDLTNEDGTIGNTYNKKSVMATFAFIVNEDISADNPIEFWVHNGNMKGKDSQGKYTNLQEGLYKPVKDNGSDSAATTYSENRFVSATDQWGAEEENFGSRKMTFMGMNENVESTEPSCEHANTTTTYENVVPSTCTVAGSRDVVVTCDDCGEEISRTHEDLPLADHDYQAVVTPPTCTEGGYTTYTCKNCTDSYTADYTNPTDHAWGEWTVTTPEVPAECGKAGTTAIETSVCANDPTHIQTRGGETIPALQHNYVGVVTEPTCTEGGYTTYTCSYCQDSYTGDYTQAKGHTWVAKSVDWDSLNTTTGAVDVNYECSNDATHTKTETVQTTSQVIQQQTEDDAEITRFSYSEGSFSDSKDVQTKAPAGHTTHVYTVPVSLAWVGDTTTAKATFKCSKCDETVQYDATVTHETKSEATCTAAKVVTYTASYEGFTSISKDVTEGEALDHNFEAQSITWDGADAVTATANFKCSRCPETKTETATVERTLKAAATKTTPAVYTYTASYDGFDSISKDVQEGEALGVNITIPKYDIGMITVNGEEVDGTKDNTINVAYGQSVTFAVTDGKDYFQGWEINNKVVDADAEYTYEAATFDMTVTPVFVEPTANTMTVVFLDKFGNKVKDYTNISSDDYATAIAADGIPVATSFPSSRFTGWDMADDDIRALTTSATIIAQYEDIESTAKYTVTVQTATGADITATALDADSYAINGQIPYDTKVTVSDDTAAGWAIDGTTVATGTSYSFFVGADVTIVKLDAAEEIPTTAVIGETLLDGTDYRYNIMATRFVPAGWTLVDYGFVYGKNLTDADLNLDNEGEQGSNVDSGAVKVAHGSMANTSNEFALNYGIKAKNAPITAKSFVVAKKGTEIKVVYSDMYVKNYN